ncbi:MAG TPA: TdeIII family type II restriction endonuclease, partial [Clostridiales bacterium]|nr:TdeIII family type II restriction endonuclease [Clostridiales bacterium]
MLSIDKIEKISYLVIKIIYERFENLSYDTTENRNAPFHKAFLNIFSDNI